ncbi:MAG TPA: IS200/IS605 family transposase [Bacteroidia bacterium]|nr:IS200/IS605 family transposase [Bacteroidia bacterium]
MSQNKLSLWVHLVWGVKNRQPLITNTVKPILYERMFQIASDKNYQISEIDGYTDHIHLLVLLNPMHSISGIVKDFKGLTSTWLNQQKITDTYFEWQDGYGAFTVSSFMVERVRNYIKNQELHHKDADFEGEMEYLKRLGDKLTV